MQDINAWLESDRSFKIGSELYAKYGTNSFLKKLLLSNPTPYVIQKLEAELIALAPARPARTDKPQPEIETANLPQKNEGGSPPIDKKSMERYLLLKSDLKLKYSQLQRNMVALDLLTDESALLQTSTSILTLQDKISDIYDLVDFFDAHKQFPDIQTKAEPIKTSKQELQALYVSASRAKARLESGKCRNVKTTTSLLERTNKRIAEIRERDSR
jgi:hypothetical protein